MRRRARGGGTCDSGHHRVERVEIEVAALYWSLMLTERQITEIQTAVKAVAEQHTTVIKRAATRHRRRLQALEDEQIKLLQSHYKGNVSDRVMRRQTERIETEEGALKQLLARSEIQLATIDEALGDALKLTEKPLETYLAASDLGRRLLNQIFFSEIRVGEGGEVQEATLDQAYAQIIARRLIRHRPRQDAPTGRHKAQKRPNAGPLALGPTFDREKIGAP